MNKLIIVTGDLCSGKSTLVNALSKKIRFLSLSKDTMKEILADTIGFETREENRKLSIATVEEMIYVFERSAEVGADLIIEANFHSMELAQIRRISIEKSYHVCLSVLTGDFKLLYERFCERAKHRHKAHLSMHLQDDYNAFVDYNDGLRKDDLVFPFHRIDMTNLNPEQALTKALEILKKDYII